MAVVPEGTVVMRSSRLEEVAEEDRHKVEKAVSVEGYYLDRYTVTNREYHEFVDAGGYEQMSLWDEAIWPAVLRIRRSHRPARPRDLGKRPVSRRQRGPSRRRRLVVRSLRLCPLGRQAPADRCRMGQGGGWPVIAEGAKPMQRRFPWGDAMDRTLANLWGSGPGATVPVTHHAERHERQRRPATGRQRLGMDQHEFSALGSRQPCGSKRHMPLKSIRGGAFDTYFESQAQCQFQSGESPLVRKHNIGFRCALGFCDVTQRRDATAPAATDDEIREPGLDTAIRQRIRT